MVRQRLDPHVELQRGVVRAELNRPVEAFNACKNGRIGRSAASALIHDARRLKELPAGSRVYLLKTEVKDTGTVFSVQSCIACDGSQVDLMQTPAAPGGSQSAQQPAPAPQPEPVRIGLGQTTDQVVGSLGLPGMAKSRTSGEAADAAFSYDVRTRGELQ